MQFRTADYSSNQASINARTPARQRRQVRMVIARRDPGVPNWSTPLAMARRDPGPLEHLQLGAGATVKLVKLADCAARCLPIRR